MTIEELPGAADRLEFQLRGSFDLDDALTLHAILSRVAPETRVRVHFHEVRYFHDLAIAMLARELTAPYGPNLELEGLSQHHHRVLHYLDPTIR